jgi:hypothetical protein
MRSAKNATIAAAMAVTLVLLTSSAGSWLIAAEQTADRVTRLQGSAFLGRRSGLVGAAVLVREESEPGRVFVTSTDAKGQFQVDGLHDGSYRVWIKRDGYRPVLKTDIEIRFPFRPVVEVLMEPSGAVVETASFPSEDRGGDGLLSIEGMVIERGGEPIGDVRIRLVHPSGEKDPRFLRSAPDGTFGLAGLPAGPWRLEASGVGFLALRMRVGLERDTRFNFSLVRQPASYKPLPLELMPPEQPIPPKGFDLNGE